MHRLDGQVAQAMNEFKNLLDGRLTFVSLQVDFPAQKELCGVKIWPGRKFALVETGGHLAQFAKGRKQQGGLVPVGEQPGMGMKINGKTFGIAITVCIRQRQINNRPDIQGDRVKLKIVPCVDRLYRALLAEKGFSVTAGGGPATENRG